MTKPSELVNVGYLVDDVDAAIAFYSKLFDFEVLTSFPPGGVRRRSGATCGLPRSKWSDQLRGTTDAGFRCAGTRRVKPHPLLPVDDIVEAGHLPP
jgi:catechol 2,3-dioxygenase-like lactoylglutathione lyase family enzyme